MIEVRVRFSDLLFGDLDTILRGAGIPPIGRRDGLMKHWWDEIGSVCVFQYVPREEYETNLTETAPIQHP
jgi:hypothetical protein